MYSYIQDQHVFLRVRRILTFKTNIYASRGCSSSNAGAGSVDTPSNKRSRRNRAPPFIYAYSPTRVHPGLDLMQPVGKTLVNPNMVPHAL